MSPERAPDLQSLPLHYYRDVSLAEALQKTVAERMHRSDVSPWQKASDIAEYQAYLKSAGRPHSTRDIAQALGVPQTRVSEQLIIATQLALLSG